MSKKISPVLIIVISVVIIGLIMGGSYVATYNKLNTLDQQAEQAMSNVDTQLQRRSDLIPNLVSTVKGYANHEEAIFTELAEARTAMSSANTIAEKTEANNKLESALGKFNMIVENYPDLKASEQFSELQAQLEGTENRIAVARKDYNTAVTNYNTYRKSFFVNIFFSSKYQDKELFKASEESKVNPTVSFDK